MAHISEAAPLQISRFYTGLYTFRNPLIVPIRTVGRRIIELYDAMSDGLNMECTNRLTLMRRPGYTAVGQTTLPGQTLYFYSFKPSSFPDQIYQLVDTTTDIVHFQPNGTSYEVLSLIPKQTPALSNFATVGAYCFIGQETLAQKWDSPGGPQGITKWGIDMFNGAFNLTGTGPTTFANLANPNRPINYLPPWQIPASNFIQPITVSLPRPSGNVETLMSQWLTLTGWGINAVLPTPPNPPNEVAGIEITIQVLSSEPVGTGLNVRLMRNGVLYGTHRTVTLPTNLGNFVTLGSPGDLWDGAWTLNDINQPGFGVAVQAVNSSAAQATISLEIVRLAVFQNVRPTVQLHAGALVSEVGYFYKYCYGNSHSGHISSPTPPSFFSIPDGVITPNGNSVQVQIEASPDPQVDSIHVYRTTDGGGNPFFELPTSPYPNASGFIGDQAMDNQLQIANICPDPHFNDAPPGGAIDPVWFAGRLWMHRQHQLFFASGPDITVGNEQEAWYPVYTFAIPNGQIIRKFGTPNGLLLVTNDEILIVRGISTASFQVLEFAKDLGMRTWTAADTDGTNVYFYTSDREFLLLNPNGFTNVSQNIANTINVVDPRLAYVAMFRYTASDNWVFVGDGTTFLYPFNQELQAWATKQQPENGVKAIGTVESSPGIFQFWRGKPPVSSTISFRDDTSFLDEGTSYPCNVTFGPIPVADMLTLAQIRDIALNNSPTSTRKILSAIANEIFPIAGKQFEILQVSSAEPPELSATPSLSYEANRYTWKSTPLPELVNHIFFRIDFSADPNPDELFIWTIGGSQTTGGSSMGAPGQLPPVQGR